MASTAIKVQADMRRRVEEKGRSGSYGNIEEMLRRKREEVGERKGTEGEVFSRSKKTTRSPELEKEKKEGMEEMMRLMREELREMRKEIKEVSGWKEEVRTMRREIKEEVKEGIKEQGEKLTTEIEGMKREFREREERWRKERGELEKRVRELEEREREGKETGGRRDETLRKLEWKIEMREREEKRSNVVIKGLRSGKNTIEKEVEKLMKDLGVEGDLKEIKEVEGREGDS